MSVSLWVLLGVGLAVFFWGVGAYNRLVRLKNAIANAFGQIDVQLKRRYDLIPNLVEVARKYLAHEPGQNGRTDGGRQPAQRGGAGCPGRR